MKRILQILLGLAILTTTLASFSWADFQRLNAWLMPNNVFFQARNAAGTGNLNLLKADASNRTILNNASGTSTRLTGAANANAYSDFFITATGVSQYWTNGTSILAAFADSTSGNFIGTTSNHNLDFRTNNGTRMTILANGTQIIMGGAFQLITTGGATSFSLGTNLTTRLTLAADGSSFLSSTAATFALGTSVSQQLDFRTNNLVRWNLTTSGTLNQDASNGGDIVMSVASTSVRQTTVTGITAAGTASGDATALTGVVNNVTTVAASTGVRLWAAGVGSVIHVRNGGANALAVYPNTGGTINGGVADAGVSIAVGAIASCSVTAASTWICSEAPAA